MTSKEMLEKVNSMIQLKDGYYFGINESNCNVVIDNENEICYCGVDSMDYIRFIKKV